MTMLRTYLVSINGGLHREVRALSMISAHAKAVEDFRLETMGRRVETINIEEA